MTTQIKITQLTDIGNNIIPSTVLPVVNLTGTPITQKTNVGNLGNIILTGAGTTYQPAYLANLAYSVVNAAQPNITSVGTLSVNTLKITGGTAGQVLSTDGAGNLSFTTVSGGGGNGLPLANGTSNFDIATADGNATVTADGETWTFGTNGVLALPNETNIYGNGQFQIDTVGGFQLTSFTDNVGSGAQTWLFDSNGDLILPDGTILLGDGSGIEYPTSPGYEWDLHSSDGNVYIGSVEDMAYIDTYSPNIGVRLRSNENDWIFGPDGNLTLPGNTFAVNYANGTQAQLSQISKGNSNVSVPTSSDNVYINTNDGNSRQWIFNKDGSLRTPGNVDIYGTINFPQQVSSINWSTYNIELSQYGRINTNVDFFANANVIGALYLKGDGSNISNINASNITNAYGDSNVISLLGDLGGNGIGNVGNIDISGNINFTNNSAVQQGSIVVNPFRTIETVTLSANSQNNATLLTLEDTGNANLRAWQDINLNTYTQTTNNNWKFDASGNLTIPGNISGSGSNGLMISSDGNVTLNSKGAQFIFDAPAGNFYLPNPGGAIVFPDDSVQNTAYIPTQTTGNWELAPGVNSVDINVPLNGTYSIWVNGNIPNGIITYTATAVVTNNNVPVLGSSYGWYYEAGNALVLTSIPTQFVGTVNNISNAVVVTTTANVFTFGITNNSGSSQVVNWGYTKL